MSPDDFRRLVAAGLTTEQIAVVMEMMERDALAVKEQEEARKAKGRKRWREWKERHDKAANVSQRLQTLANDSRVGVARVEDNLQTKNSTGEKKHTNSRAKADEFEAWYRHYPHKVQRGAAERAFSKARSLASLDDLIAGVHRYVASKPPDRQWQNPATWLNGKGWMDAPAAVTPRANGPPPEPSKPRNAGELARRDLREMGLTRDATDSQTRYLDQGDRGANPPGLGPPRQPSFAAGR